MPMQQQQDVVDMANWLNMTFKAEKGFPTSQLELLSKISHLDFQKYQ
jgi:hypothetical protein